MKKRILAVVCAAMLVLGTSMTAFAAPSPSAEALIAPRIDLVIESEEVAIQPAAVSNNSVAIAKVPEVFKVSVLEALQICMGEQIRVLNVLDVKNLAPKADGTPVALTAPGVTAADNVIVLAYNDALGIWEFLPVATLNGQIYTVFGGHSKVSIMINGVLPEAMRFQANSSKEAVIEYLSENGTVEAADFLNGGKDMTTAMEVSSDALVAPFTGDAEMMVVVFAAIAFAAAFAVSGKKLLAYN